MEGVYIIYKKEDISFYEPTLWVYLDKDKANKHLEELNESSGDYDIIYECIINESEDDDYIVKLNNMLLKTPEIKSIFTLSD